MLSLQGALRSRDLPGLERLLAADFTFRGAGKALSRSEWLAAVPLLCSEQLTLEEGHGKVYGDAAVITGKLIWKGFGEAAASGLLGGIHSDATFQLTDFWVKQKSTWGLVTRVAERLETPLEESRRVRGGAPGFPPKA